MLRIRENRFRRTGFNHLARAHDQHVITHVSDHGEIMGNEQVAQAKALLQLVQQIKHLGLHGDVQRRDRFVANQHLRIWGEGTCNGQTLALSARESGRIALCHLGRQAHQPQQLLDSSGVGARVPRLPKTEGVSQYRAGGKTRIERRQRVLVHGAQR